MRASRLLNLLMLLQVRGRLSATALAAELEVSPRTILRDIDELSLAGVPVFADRGRNGGFQLREGWSTELTGLTGDESRALFLSGLPGAATELGLGTAAVSARFKMLAALPGAFREDASLVSARLHIDPVDWYRAAEPPPHLRAVASAVWRQRIVAIRYESWTDVRDRVVKPLGLILKAGVWYLAALAERSAQPRTYRISSILQLTERDATFKYPRGFQLEAYWEDSRRRFEAEIYTGTATLRATARGVKLLRELSATIEQSVQRSVVPDARRREWLRVTIPTESIDHATRQLLSIGRDVEVLEPAALRASVRGVVGELKRRYG